MFVDGLLICNMLLGSEYFLSIVFKVVAADFFVDGLLVAKDS